MEIFSPIKNTGKILFVTVLLTSFTIFNPFDNVIQALKKGQVESLSHYFDNMIDISLSGKSDSYSKSQASVILKGFFSKNKVQDFKVIHKGTSKNGGRFGIGNMITSNGNYRVTFFFRQKGNKVVLQELRFKKE